MKWKEVVKKVMYPPLALIWILLPISSALLTITLIFGNAKSVASICIYLLAFYELVVVCCRVPNIINWCKKYKENNKLLTKYFSDVHFRLNFGLYSALIINIAFGMFQLVLGIYHHSIWFYSMSAYYTLLAIIRFFILKHTRAYSLNEECIKEIKLYLFCGGMLLLLNLALAVIIFFIVYQNKTFVHHEITTIVIATYTFVSLTFAIISCIKYRRFNSPTYSASKIISLVSACVSMFTLETTMLSTFGDEMERNSRGVLLGVSGGVITIFILTIAIYMVVKGSNELQVMKKFASDKNEKIDNGEKIMKEIFVVAGIIEKDNKILCMQRSAGKHDYVSYKWEFPGGKIEEGESEEEALIRELREEMELDVEVLSKFESIRHEYPDLIVNMSCYLCSTHDEDFKLNVHKDYRWLGIDELDSLDWAGADLPVVKKLMDKNNMHNN